jgi:hypothetical protein
MMCSQAQLSFGSYSKYAFTWLRDSSFLPEI